MAEMTVDPLLIFMALSTLAFSWPILCSIWDTSKVPETRPAYLGLLSVYVCFMLHVIVEYLVRFYGGADNLFLFSDFKNFSALHLVFAVFHWTYAFWLGFHIKRHANSYIKLSQMRSFINLPDKETCDRIPAFILFFLGAYYFSFLFPSQDPSAGRY